MVLNPQNVGLSTETIQKIKSVINQSNKVTEIILYGSRAKGNYQPGSDIDLSLKGDDLNFSELLEIESKLDGLSLPYKIDLNLFSAISNSELKEHIKRVGIKL